MTSRALATVGATLVAVLLLLAPASPAEAGGRDGYYGHAPAHGYGYGSRHYGPRHAGPRHWSAQRGYHDGHRRGDRYGPYRHDRPYRHGPRDRHAPRYAYPRHWGYRKHGDYGPHRRFRHVGYGYGYGGYGPGVYLPPVWFGGLNLHFRF